MPKLMIYSNESPTYLLMPDGNEYNENSVEANALRNDPDAGAKWMRRAIKLGWVKGGYAEIGMAAFDPSREMAVDGIFMTYDRAGLNDLINGLRKMRDSAFGKDA